jgi:biopolymer transport protein TolR
MKKELISTVNVTSLVDVSLTLLIIFILAAPLLKASIDVSLPKSEAAKFVEKTGIEVSITKKGKIFVEKKKVKLENLVYKLKILKKAKTCDIVYLHADKDVDYGFVIKVLGKIRVAGIREVGLVAQIK